MSQPVLLFLMRRYYEKREILIDYLEFKESYYFSPLASSSEGTAEAALHET